MNWARKNYFFILLTGITVLILSLFIFDVFPFLRGPGPYPPGWQWPYQFSNTLDKLWLPLLIGICIVLTAYFVEKITLQKKWTIALFLTCFILLGYLFQLSILYYSRAGIFVIIHRILHPMISGYFTTSLSITSISDFLKNFDAMVGTYPMYAKFHPPFADLLFVGIYSMSKFLLPLFNSLTAHSPSHSDTAHLWLHLLDIQRLTVLLSAFGIPLFSLLTIIPLFGLIHSLFGKIAAIRAAILYPLIPCTILFTPLNDVFHPFFTTASLFFFMKGLSAKNSYYFLISGLLLSIGVLFTLTFIPLIVYLITVGLLYWYQEEKKHSINLTQSIFSFTLGFLILPFILLFFQYNIIHSMFTLLTYHNQVEHHRDYLKGLFYAPFDFFLFLGIPIALTLLSNLWDLRLKLSKKSSMLQSLPILSVSFWLFLLVVTLSGSVRVESARIWTPYIPIALVVFISEIQKKKVTTNQFLLILLLQIIEVIVLQSVLVTVW